MAFAAGKNAYGICDITGFRYRIREMKKTWDGLLGGPDQWSPKEPQLDPLKAKADPIALRQPRPDRVEPVTVAIGGPGDSAFSSDGMKPAPPIKNFSADGQIGKVEVTIS